jgi:hypothetical protein
MPNINILQASQGASPFVNNELKDILLTNQSILNILPIISIPEGQGFTLQEIETAAGNLGTAQERSLNEDYTDNATEDIPKLYGTKVIGDSAQVDYLIQRQSPGDPLTKEMRKKATNLTLYLNKLFINGSSATNHKQFDGLKAHLVGDTEHLINTGADLTVNTSAATCKTLLKHMDKALESVKSGGNMYFLMSQEMYNAINRAALEIGANVLGQTENFLNQRVSTYQGVPFFWFGRDETNSKILDQTDADLGGSSHTSIYLANFDADFGLAGLTVQGFQTIPEEKGKFMRESIEVTMGLVPRTNSIARIARLKIA